MRTSGKPEVRCNPSPHQDSSAKKMDARVKPAHDGDQSVLTPACLSRSAILLRA
jgi:hypothetical protein